MIKYKDLKYYIDRDKLNIEEIKYITLSKDLFESIGMEVCESYFEINEDFEYGGIKFKLEQTHKYKNYAIVYFHQFKTFGYGYIILSEIDRMIKNIIE